MKKKVQSIEFSQNVIKTPFGPPLAQKIQNKDFPKKSFCSILTLYAVVTSYKKSEKIHALILYEI